MVAPLLTTKLYSPPLRPELVPRERLINRLNAGLPARRHGFARKLTLISAPAGFGKTTLVSSWIHQLEDHTPSATASRLSGPLAHSAWLSLEEGDNDRARFLTYLVAALQTVHENVGESALAALQSPQTPGMETILTALINDIAALPIPEDVDRTDAIRPIILVLDDYHLIEAQAIHDILTFLLDHLPPNLHLVIATRADPPLPVAQLRGRGQLTELRQSDLRFTNDETAGFLNTQFGLHLSSEDVGALEARTEGWIAGLQMAALSMLGKENVDDFVRAFTGSDRYILDYLVEEVLQRQPDHIQTFLLQTSILDRLTGSLCDAVVTGAAAELGGRGDREATASQPCPPCRSGQKSLEYLECNNLFVVPLDSERRWYRYHRLFSDCLRLRLRREHLDLVPALFLRASLWHEEQGLMDEAIEHALSAGDAERAAHLIERAAESTMLRSEWSTLLRWVDALPENLTSARPRLGVYEALALVLGGQPLDVAESRLREAVEADSDGSVVGEVTAFRALIAAYRGDRERTAELSERALDLLPKESLFFRSFVAGFLGLAHLYVGDVEAATRAFEEAVRVSERTGNLNISVLARYHLADLAALQGRVSEAAALYEQALEAAVDPSGRRRPIAGIALIGLGRIEAELYNLEDAGRHLTQGIELIKKWGEAGAISGYTGLARVRQAKGDDQGALEAIKTAKRLAERFDAMDIDDLSVAVSRARFWIVQGNLDAADRWATERELVTDLTLETLYEEIRTTSSLYRFMEYATLAWLRVAQGRPADALIVLKPLLEAAGERGWVTYGVEALLLQALALQEEGKDVKALESLEQALSLARPGRFVRLFVERGAPMARLLSRAVEQGIHPEFAGSLLTAFRASDGAEPVRGKKIECADMIEPLSDRELEVLRFLPTHLTSNEIAEELFISVHTVRFHIKNIYSKLHVHSRAGAVDRARVLDLL
jgi:LuxR family maltose regulon positive regulatory protein